MRIQDLFNAKEISVRAFNVCDHHRLKELSDVLSYYQANKTFGNLKNCGKNTNEELIALCLRYRDQVDDLYNEEYTDENKILAIIDNLSSTQTEIINHFIAINVNYLSVRSKNAITVYLDSNFSIQNVRERILNFVNFDFYRIKNVGEKSVIELKNFFDVIVSFIENISEQENENHLETLRNRLFIEKTFSVSNIPDEILESQSIFRIVDFLINEKVIFEKSENIIFQKSFRIYDNQTEISLDEIATELNLTSERVRQLRKHILDKLFSHLQFVSYIKDDLYNKYNIDTNQPYIFIDENLNTQINTINSTNFSSNFNTVIVYCFLSSKYDLIGIPDDVLLPKLFYSRTRHKWNDFYLVNKDISPLFDANKFVDDIDRRINERIKESYKFNFTNYLSRFSTSTNIEDLDIVSYVAEKILSNEFGIHLDLDGNFNFTRNAHMLAYEYAYAALRSLGAPSKVDVIRSKIEEMHPFYETNDAKVRVSMKRQYGFVPVGRSSIFGLQEWENNLENFRGGTIRSIVADFLDGESEPKHISVIAQFVLIYRPDTYERSILDNLKADETNTFIFFKNSVIGLSSKTYDDSFVRLGPTASTNTNVEDP